MTHMCEKCGDATATICTGCHGAEVDKSIYDTRRRVARAVKKALDKAVRGSDL